MMHHPVRRRKRRSQGGACATSPLRNLHCVDVMRGTHGFGFTISGQQPCLLSCIVPGSPAEVAGLQPGHALVAVNGRSVARLPHDTVVRLIGSSCGRLRLHVSPHWHERSSSSDSDTDTPRLNPVRVSPHDAAPPAELRAVVGYLGTIELPRHLTPGSRLAVIRSCVRRMRAERRVHTVVALSVRRRHSVLLSDSSGATIAEFGAERVAFCGACADDRRFFGLVTASEAGSACHVFMIDPSLHPHHAHLQRAAAFRVTCTPNGVGCAEFPSHADPILRAVAALTAAASPPPPPPRSNASSCPSSNSDSGIGFRDEDSAHDRLTVRAMPDPPVAQMRKLSPKVYGLAAHSLEDLPAASPTLPSGDESMTSIEHWGSLQDLARLDQGRQRRRRKHPTHHQHPMPPPMLVPRTQSPLPAPDDESDSEQPFKKWCSGSYLGLMHRLNNEDEPEEQALPELPPLTPVWGACGRYLQESHKDSAEARGVLGAPGRSHSDGGELDPSKPNCFDSFEKLLDDSNGMHAFSEFLKKEFSHENIYFWVACEKYRRLKDQGARKSLARTIFQKHLCSGAPEPVNVDSQARQAAKDGLEEAKLELFVACQKQIFNLMKFDSYPRFLKCDSYKDASEHSGQVDLDPDLILHAKDEPNPGKLKKSQSDAEDRRRKSLLPWGRKNSGHSRSKSRDRGAEERGQDDSSSVRSELTGSRSSLASSDLALIQRNSNSRQSVSLGDVSQTGELCRVILPDGATTVISTVRGETVKQLVAKLLEKRGVQFSTFEVFISDKSSIVNLSDESTVLSGKEVRVEQRVVFRLDLPSKKTLGVKAKAGKTLAEVLRPILNKHGYKLENATVTLICDTTPLDVNHPITTVENERLQICISGANGAGKSGKSTLDEITNKVFEELLQGKPPEGPQGSDQGSVKSEDWSSDHGSGIFGRFLRRDSTFADKTRESRNKKGAVPRLSDAHENRLRVPQLKVTIKGQSESEELYEGLKRAQRGRLEDQRGTDINFELPDFLKDKENSPRWLQKSRLSEGDCLPLMSAEGIDLSSGLLPTPEQAEAFFGGRMTPLSPPLRHPMDPPPLPPKPKTYPKHVSKWTPASSSDDERNSTTIV